MKRARGAETEDAVDVRKEEALGQMSNEYEAIIAMAKEARRLNAAPGVFLEKGEKVIPRAVENFVGGKVEYVIEGEECEDCAGENTGKTARKAAKKSSKKK